MTAKQNLTERERQRRLMARKRAESRDITISKCMNHRRRRRAQRDIFYGLRTYFPHRFYNPFTDDQSEMVSLILHTIKHGGDQAIAAVRGDGKTTLVECVVVLAICFGWVRFPALFGATGPFAEQILTNIKLEFECNQLLLDDFPEVCEPIWALEGAAQRCGGQTVGGVRTRMQWSGDGVVFPTVKGSKASGAVIMTRGLDGAIRGMRHASLRPDFALVDDPDTEESAVSPSQQAKREKAIDRSIAGLAGPGRKIGRIILGTLINGTCIIARYTDAATKPSFKGKRFSLVKQWPEREDLWSEFIRLRQQGCDINSGISIDAAHAFYLANRAEMDRGAVVSNQYRAIRDADPPEASSLEHVYNRIADIGRDAFDTEYQNQPPKEEGPETSGITPALVAKRLSGYPQHLVPEGRIALTAYLDVGRSKGCHYAVAAWYPGARGHIIDYGVQEVHNIEKVGPESAVLSALRARREEWLEHPYCNEHGEPLKIDLCLVDSGDGSLEETVYRFVREAGMPFRASKGFGSRYGQSPFKRPQKRTRELKPAHGWYESLQRVQGGSLWLVGLDVDHWKEWVHDRFLTEPRDDGTYALRRGALTVFGTDAQRHHSFSRHICAEMMEIEFDRVGGRGLRKRWVVKNKNNDWFDCVAGCAAGAGMCGVTLGIDARESSIPGVGGGAEGAGGGWHNWGQHPPQHPQRGSRARGSARASGGVPAAAWGGGGGGKWVGGGRP